MSELLEKLREAQERAASADKELADLEYRVSCVGKSVLDLPMKKNDAGAETVREYLKALLSKIWEEGEGFSGKRPFGNSGWDHDLYKPLIESGMIAGKIDEWGCIENCDGTEADAIIFAAIDEL